MIYHSLILICVIVVLSLIYLLLGFFTVVLIDKYERIKYSEEEYMWLGVLFWPIAGIVYLGVAFVDQVGRGLPQLVRRFSGR